MDLRMLLTHEGATYLREWADVMPRAIYNIGESTEKLIGVYQSVSESVGPHREYFYQMLICIKTAQENFREVSSVLTTTLNNTADKIDCYVTSTEDGDSTQSPPVKKLIPHR